MSSSTIVSIRPANCSMPCISSAIATTAAAANTASPIFGRRWPERMSMPQPRAVATPSAMLPPRASDANTAKLMRARIPKPMAICMPSASPAGSISRCGRLPRGREVPWRGAVSRCRKASHTAGPTATARKPAKSLRLRNIAFTRPPSWWKETVATSKLFPSWPTNWISPWRATSAAAAATITSTRSIDSIDRAN